MNVVRRSLLAAWVIPACALVDADSGHDSEGATSELTDGSCGNCDDGNRCTRDTCANMACTHTPVADGPVSCRDPLSLDRCDGGTLRNISCPGACEAAGYNTYADCSSSQLACLCDDTQGAACLPGAEYCVGYTGFVVECVAAAALGTTNNLWHIAHCDDICRDAGYLSSLGCDVDPDDESKRVCWCSNSTTPDPGYECSVTAHCPTHYACSSGRCVPVECTSDSHCAWCARCSGYTCRACGQDAYGDCAC